MLAPRQHREILYLIRENDRLLYVQLQCTNLCHNIHVANLAVEKVEQRHGEQEERVI